MSTPRSPHPDLEGMGIQLSLWYTSNMLQMDEGLMAIDEGIDRLVAAICASPEYTRYKATQKAIEADAGLQELVADFESKKQAYEDLEAYRNFLPEARELRRSLYALKRQLDLHPLVSQLRQDENALQALLAQVSHILSQAVDSDIFVDTGLPLAPRRKAHKKGQGGRYIKEKGGGTYADN